MGNSCVSCKCPCKPKIVFNDNIFKNSFRLIYKINQPCERIRLFGSKFYENNRNNCRICINFELMNLIEFYEVKNNEKELRLSISMDEQVTDLSYIFNECSMLKKIDDFHDIKLENVTSISNMFYGCSSLESLPDISNLNTINVEDMSYLFYECSSLKSLPDISSWNTKNVKTMKSMFSFASSLVSLPNLSNWNTENVEDMSDMFSGCSSLTEIPDISNWDTSKVTDISNIFSKCTRLEFLPDISKWNTKRVSDMSCIFHECTSLKSLCPISEWKTNNVTNMSYMFYNCSSLIMLPYISKWDTSNVENMSYMFYGCSSLKVIDEGISNWNTDKVKDISDIFTNCNSLQKVPDISNWKIYKENNAKNMKNGKSEHEVKGSMENDNLIFIPQIEEDQKKIKEEEDKLKIIKLKILDNQKKLREQKENTESMSDQQVNKKVKNVLEDMCIYGEINKKEIINEKKKHPEKFIETSEALKLENEDIGLFGLGLLSKNLEDLGIKTAIEKDENQDTQDADSTGLQFITNGMIDKKKYDLHFDLGEKRNEEILNNKEEFEKFKENLKLKLSKDYNIPPDEIIVTFPQKGSLHVQVIFQSMDFHDFDKAQFINKFKNDPEFKDLSNLKDIHEDIIMGAVKITRNNLDPNGNRTYGWPVGEKRGGKDYDSPIGWIGIGLKVLDKYDNGDNTWIGMANVPGEWCVAYHGVARGQDSDNVKKITGIIYNTTFKEGLNQAHENCDDQYHPGKKVGRGVYCTPTIATAEDLYAGISNINGTNYKTVLMVRVKPSAIRHCDTCESSRAPYNYWVVNGTTDEIRPYRILYKKDNSFN